MKGQAKRFVDHRGQGFSLPFRRKPRDEGADYAKPVSFFSLCPFVKRTEDFVNICLCRKNTMTDRDKIPIAAWRHASWLERGLTAAGVASAFVSSCGIAAAVLIYGEVTSLFVARTKMEDPSASSSTLLPLFGGAAIVANGSSLEEHKMALIADSLAFTFASLAVMAAQFSTAAAAVGLADYAANSLAARLRIKLLRAVLNHEIAFFDTNKGADIVTTITQSVTLVQEGTGAALAQAAFLLGGAATLATAAAVAGWKLALAGLALLPPALIVSAVVAHLVSRYAGSEALSAAAALTSVREALQHARTVRTHGALTHELDRYASLLRVSLAQSRRRARAAALGAGLAAMLAYSINALVLALGARLVARDLPLPPDEREYDPGVLVIVLFCTFMSLQQVCLSAPHTERVHVARGAASSVRAALQSHAPTSELKDKPARRRPPGPYRGDIVFDNVYFNYPSRPDTKVLRGFSLKISAGQCVCLVGGSGSGKSTVLQLLQALYEPTSGTITVDGIPLKELDVEHFRQSIGVVGQEPVLFSGSVHSNVCAGAAPGLRTRAHVTRAALTAHAHDFIINMEKGYDTELGTRNTLSGGQKQRLCIARAALRQPPVLLLDEPTAALDPHAETQVQAALDAASAGRTTVMITHRLSTIPADAIVAVVEQGAVREIGTSAELARTPGSAYRALLDSDGVQLASLPSVKVQDETADSRVEQRCASPPLSRQSTLTRGCRSRVSRRVSSASVSSLRAPAAAAAVLLHHATEPVPEVDEEDEEDNDAAPAVSFINMLRMQWPERWLLAGGGLCAFLVGASMPAYAYLFSELYGLFTLSDASIIVHQSTVYAGYFLLVAAAAAAATAAQGWLLADAGNKLTYRLSVNTATTYLKQEQAWLDRPENSVGSLCARLASDCPAAQGATGAALGAALQGASTLLLGGALAAAYSWKMTAASLVALPLVIGAIWLESVVSRSAVAASSRAGSRAAALAGEAVAHVRTLHALGAREDILSRYESAILASRPRALTSVVRGAAFGASVSAPTLGYCGALAAAGHLIATDDMPLHYAILVSEALIYGAWMMSEALAALPARRAAARAAARLPPPPRASTPASTTTPTPAHASTDGGESRASQWQASGSIAVRDVWVQHGRDTTESRATLRGVNMSLPSGATVALVGRSGCGKTTLLQVLLREIEPTRGQVLLDGTDIARLPLDTVRAQFAYVEQEGALFSRSIRDNLAYGASQGATMDDVITAATHTGLHSFIAALPQGYATVMSGGGASVSGGQRQRLSVSRALLRPAPVMLLDEPTSALDPHTEQVVMAALSGSGRTLVIAAHRLDTVKNADIIYVMDEGRVVEWGCHDALLQTRGLYRELWRAQHRHAQHRHVQPAPSEAHH